MTTESTKKAVRPYSTLTACEKLAVIEEQLMALATGKQRKIVRHGEHWLETHPGSVTWLHGERVRLERLCASERGSAPGLRRAITLGRTGG